MAIEITLTGEDAERYLASTAFATVVREKLVEAVAAPVNKFPVHELEDSKPAPKRGRKASVASTTEEQPTTTEEKTSSEGTAKAAGSPSPAAFDLEKDVRPRVLKIVKEGDDAAKAKLKELFAAFKVNRVSELKPDQYAAFMSQSEKL